MKVLAALFFSVLIGCAHYDSVIISKCSMDRIGPSGSVERVYMIEVQSSIVERSYVSEDDFNKMKVGDRVLKY